MSKNKVIKCHEGRARIKNRVYLLGGDKLNMKGVLYVSWGYSLLELEPYSLKLPVLPHFHETFNNLALTEMIRALCLPSSLHELK